MHRVVEEERLVLVPLDEINGERLDDVRVVRILSRVDRLAIFNVDVLPIPTARRVVGTVFIKAPSFPAAIQGASRRASRPVL